MDIRDRATLGVLVGASSFTLLPVSVISPLLSTIAEHFGTNHGVLKAQSLITLSGIGMMVGGPLSGWLVDRIGTRAIFLAMLALFAVAGSAGLYLDSLIPLLASRVLLGMSAAGIASASYVMIAARYEEAGRARVLGYQIAVIAIVGIVSLLVAGVLAKAYGWRSPFAIYLISLPMLATAAIARLPARSKTAASQEVDGGGVSRLLPTYLVIVPLYVAAHMFILQLSFVLAADGVRSPLLQSQIMTAIMAMTFVSGLTYGQILERLGNRWTFVAILGVMGASDLLLGVTHGIGPTVAACVLSGFSGAAIVPYIIGSVLARAPVQTQGCALGLMYTAMYLGDFINPLLVNPLRNLVGNHEAFAVIGTLLLILAMLRAMRRDSSIPSLI